MLIMTVQCSDYCARPTAVVIMSFLFISLISSCSGPISMSREWECPGLRLVRRWVSKQCRVSLLARDNKYTVTMSHVPDSAEMTSGLSSELLYLLCMREVPRYLQQRLCQAQTPGPQRRSQHSSEQPLARLPPKPQFKFVQDNQASGDLRKWILTYVTYTCNSP